VDAVEAIGRDRYEYPDPRVQERMEILWLKIKGETHERIGELANVSRSTVQRTLKLYAEKGLDGVRTFAWKGRVSALTPHRETLAKEFEERPPHSAHDAVRRIEELTGVKRKVSRVRKFMKETLKMKCLKVAAIPVPPKKTVEEHAQTQESFLQTELEPRLKEAREGKRTLMWVDASHFVLASFLGHVWCFVRKYVRAASGRQRYNVLGALNAVTHELITEINTSYINAESVCALLRKIASLGKLTPITLVMDNARYQHCALVENLAKALGIELLFLPSYSPNLNLIERLWKFMKKEALNSRHHQDFKKFQAAIDGCIADLPTKHKAALDTLMTHNFQTWNNVSLLSA
jgi:transposase